MIKIKILVLVLYFSDIFACSSEYCNICPEHTLCKYKVSGPSPQCMGYDKNALLTKTDINDILEKINERRNFIANGKSRFLPEAANMKKIVWSEELAIFAQRWVDQCDISLKPDRKDKCRDLDHSEVGQSIATIEGSSARYEKLNVRSFVEIWFMESMEYTGNVAFYNQSRDHKANYFTQLIWADTDKVGCGKARFLIKNAKPVAVHRLVCNFAPKGNVHRKPVYTIGYAATQCSIGMEPDSFFPGLCSHPFKQKGALQSTYPTSTSLLRILNLFNNDSSTQDIDPLNNNLNQMSEGLKEISSHQSNAMQELYYGNNSYDAVKRSYENEKIWNSQQLKNSTHFYGDYLQKRDKGHSRVYHGHDHRIQHDYLYPETINHNSRKYDYTQSTVVNLYMQQDYRKHNVAKQCTRKSDMKGTNYASSEFVPYKCTRRSKSNCHKKNDCMMIKQKCEEQESRTTLLPSSQEFCACNLFSAYQMHPNRCAHNPNCDCVNANCATKHCSNMLRARKGEYDKVFDKQSDLQYYDIFPYIAQQSASRSVLKDLHRTRSFLPDSNPWPPIRQPLKSLDRRKQLKRHYSERKRRVADEEKNFKPFWQMDEYVNSNQPHLKSMRYTTLSNKKNLQNKRTLKRIKTTMKTEPITLTYKERSNSGKRITEKYLSFDELMHLRKLNAEDSGGRRYYDEKQILRESNTLAQTASETTTSPSTKVTPEYSFNTPYIRIKHCTRKLTCTWTAASLTDSAGSIIPGGGGNAVGGSRTPPGYVEGCTRTSTCTRDYMNRNKMATLPIETTSPEPEPGDDEDYCERRSLNKRSNVNSVQGNQNKTSKQNKSFLNESLNNSICYIRNIRTKRQDNIRNLSIISLINRKRETEKLITHETNLLSYGDLYYNVVKKIIEMWKIAKSAYSHDKCLCNDVKKLSFCYLFLFLTLVLKYFEKSL